MTDTEAKFAVVVMLPEAEATRMDFMSREFATIDDVCDAIREVNEQVPNFRILAFCHVEDLPLLQEAPEGWK